MTNFLQKLAEYDPALGRYGELALHTIFWAAIGGAADFGIYVATGELKFTCALLAASMLTSISAAAAKKLRDKANEI